MMKRMRRKVEEEFKPMLQMLEAKMLPHGRLLAGAMDLVIGHYEETFHPMDEGHRKLCWYEFCLTPELFLAMAVSPFLGEAHPTLMSLGTPEVCWQYVDRAEQSGMPSDICVLDKFMLGAKLLLRPNTTYVVPA